jgi:hypothetical protein
MRAAAHCGGHHPMISPQLTLKGLSAHAGAKEQ